MNPKLLLPILFFQVSGDFRGNGGEKEDDYGQSDECNRRRVHDVAEAYERRDDCADNVAGDAENRGGFAGLRSSFIHRQGVGCRENVAEAEEGHDHAALEEPDAVDGTESDGLGDDARYRNPCSDDGRALEETEAEGRHGAGGHEKGIEADYESVDRLGEAVVGLEDEGSGGYVGEK